MDLLTFMQKVPITQEKLCIEYIADGLKEIQKSCNENLTSSKISFVEDQEEYDFPDNLVSFKHILVDTNKVTDYKDYICEIKGRKIRVLKYNWATDDLIAPDSDVTDALQIWYTKSDTGFSDETITATSEFNVRDEVIDALLEYVRMQFTPQENIKMRDRFQRLFYSKVSDIDFLRSNQISVVPKPYLRSLRVLTRSDNFYS